MADTTLAAVFSREITRSYFDWQRVLLRQTEEDGGLSTRRCASALKPMTADMCARHSRPVYTVHERYGHHASCWRS